MIRLSGRLICRDAEEAALVTRHLPDHIRASRDEPGCLSFAVTQTEDPMVWRVEESFVSTAAFEHHQSRTRASPWHAATRHIRREYQTSEG